jgi:sugar phosphate permease
VVATVIGIPFAFLAVMTASPMVFFLSMAVVQLALFATFSPVNAIFLGSVPSAVRATAMGVSIFVGRLLGDMISIWLVGVLSDAWHNLTVAMLVIPCVLLLNLLFWGIALRQPALESLSLRTTS